MRLQVGAARIAWLPLLTVLSLAAGAQAQTPCVAPEVPASPFSGPTEVKRPTLPVRPPCLDQLKGSPAQKVNDNTCANETIAKYNREIRAYNSSLVLYHSSRRDYTFQIQEYVKNAGAYAQCELDAARN
jgi:hypothetical protein